MIEGFDSSLFNILLKTEKKEKEKRIGLSFTMAHWRKWLSEKATQTLIVDVGTLLICENDGNKQLQLFCSLIWVCEHLSITNMSENAFYTMKAQEQTWALIYLPHT